jgi:hypothetical protein
MFLHEGIIAQYIDILHVENHLTQPFSSGSFFVDVMRGIFE